jgi:biotin transport system substrate-specific component
LKKYSPNCKAGFFLLGKNKKKGEDEPFLKSGECMQTLTLTKAPARDFILVLLASFLICLSGKISFPLWFTPVPIATQNSIVLLIAALLGSKRGSAAVFLFLFQGALGLPVFSNGGFGFAHFFSPTGGYLIGYLVAAFVVGVIVEKRGTLKSASYALILGNGLIYLCGASYLATFVGLKKAFSLGVAPFIIGDVLKTVVILKLLTLFKAKAEKNTF